MRTMFVGLMSPWMDEALAVDVVEGGGQLPDDAADMMSSHSLAQMLCWSITFFGLYSAPSMTAQNRYSE